MSKKPTPKKDAIDHLLSETNGQQNILTIQRAYVKMTGSLEAALMLSQIIYWSDRATMPDGWFAKTFAEWADEICLSEYHIRKATRILKDFGLKTKKVKFQGAPTVHYRMDMQKFRVSILKFFGMETEKFAETYTETTTETTTKTLKEKDSASADAVIHFQPMYKKPIGPEPEKNAEKEINIAIGPLIKAWVETQQVVEENPYAIKGYRSAARALYLAGITPDDLIAFIRYRKSDAFWSDKTLTWKHIKDNILTWKTAQNALPDNPAHREYIPEPKEQCHGGTESALILLDEITRLFVAPPLEEAS